MITEKQGKVQELLRQRHLLEKLFLSVNELRSIRIQKLQRQGYKDADSLTNAELQLLQKCRDDVSNYNEVQISNKRGNDEEMYCYLSIIIFSFTQHEVKEESDEDYYYGAANDINKLISIRYFKFLSSHF